MTDDVMKAISMGSQLVAAMISRTANDNAGKLVKLGEKDRLMIAGEEFDYNEVIEAMCYRFKKFICRDCDCLKDFSDKSGYDDEICTACCSATQAEWAEGVNDDAAIDNYMESNW